MKIISKILSFIASNQTNARWLKLLIVLTIIMLAIMYKNKYMPTEHTEGFTQDERYVLKSNSDIYDSFYAGIYDYLQKTEKRTSYEMQNIVEATQPDKVNSVILDIGCGTGCMVETLRNAGYRAYGIDKSNAMVSVAKEKYSNSSELRSSVLRFPEFPRIPSATRPEYFTQCGVKHGDANDAMAFDRETFSHILCLNKTIYEFEDKIAFFRNCYHWLVPGGYLIVHTVQATKFNPIVPAGIPSILQNPQQYSKERITDTAIDFADFKYKSVYDFSRVDKTGKTVHTETFTDKQTGNIRENEHVLIFEPEKEIIEKAHICQFMSYGMFSMKEYNDDGYQNVYIFQKI
jgi:SAM-dependent methyltransferase